MGGVQIIELAIREERVILLIGAYGSTTLKGFREDENL